jgi:MFS family permease
MDNGQLPASVFNRRLFIFNCQCLSLIKPSAAYLLAQLLSGVLHPLLMPTMLHAVLFTCTPTVLGQVDEPTQWRLLLVIFILTFLVPLFFTFFLLQYGLAGSWSWPRSTPAEEIPFPAGADQTSLFGRLQMQDRSRRFVPFLFTTFIYGADTFLFTRNLSALHLSVVILGAMSVCIGLVTVITLFWKISAHGVGIGGMIGFLFGIGYSFTAVELLYPVVITILVAGMLLSARLYLNSHTPAETGSGFLLGLFICFTAVVIWG